MNQKDSYKLNVGECLKGSHESHGKEGEEGFMPLINVLM